MNPYDMLNVRDNATDNEIKKSYLFYKNKYNLKEYSGDKSYAVKRLADIEKAYKILSNPQLRAAFDHRHDSHVKSHISKKDVYKEMYVDDPIGTHEHRDFEIAMKRYNSRKTIFDLYKNPIKTFGDDMFEDENIQEYSSFTGKKVSNAFRNFLIAMLVLFFAFSLLSPIISIFNDLGDMFKGAITTEEESTLTFDTEYNNNYQYNSYDYDSNSNGIMDYKENNYSPNHSSSSPSTKDVDTYYEINDYYTDTQLRQVYSDYYADEFSTFTEFKEYYNDLFTRNN